LSVHNARCLVVGLGLGILVYGLASGYAHEGLQL